MTDYHSSVEEHTCKDCKERHEACHDTCEPYLAWKTERDAIREKRQKQKEYERISKAPRYEKKEGQL